MRFESCRNLGVYSIGVLSMLGLSGMCIAQQEQAGKWPEKPVRIVVATAPGGGDDFVTRLLAPKLSELLRQAFVVENRPGAGGMIGQTLVAKAQPDGYTWLLAGGSMAGARYVNASITYDVLRDFTPVSLLETSQFVMVVHPSVPARTVKEYLALARSEPGKMTFATLGPGQMPYWSAVLFNNMAGIKAVEVAYKGFAEALSDVSGGRVDYFFVPSSTAIAHRGRLRAFAVTGLKRSPAIPEVPTMSEAALPGYDMPAWRSIMGPAGVRRDMVVSLNNAIRRALDMPDVREKLAVAGSEPSASTPEELSARFVDWIERFGQIARKAGIKPQ
jgi:tripartite-type tricarboxylate transporter receptor subunit TctC